MKVAICPGIHDPKLTESFLKGLSEHWPSQNLPSAIPHPKSSLFWVFPAQDYPAYSAIDILRCLWRDVAAAESLIFISFSAGVVGALGAAWGWQQGGGQVRAFIALDGWGMPLLGNFPIHRLSHDYFTHWSSALLGTGTENFYADPPVEHLDLWRSPQTAQGWGQTTSPQATTPTTAATFLVKLLQRYGVQSP